MTTLILSVFFSISSSAYDVEVDGIYYNLVKSRAYVTYGKKEYIGDVVIPSSIKYNGKEYDVTNIGDEAFNNCTELTSISLPNTVTEIGAYAFAYCNQLTTINIPSSVTTIKRNAFGNCFMLQYVNITDLEAWCNIDFEEIYANPLYHAQGLYINGELATDIDIPETITEIKRLTFYYYTKLKSVKIPNTVESIGEASFYYCINLNEVIIPNSVTTIEPEAFKYCEGLTSITIPNSVSSLGRLAFYSCKSLSAVTLPESMTSIEDNTFYGCSSLTSVTIPNSVTSIGSSAFSGCSSLTSVTIPNSVTSIGGGTFNGCSSLTSVTIPNSVSNIGQYAFYKCTNLSSIELPNTITSVEPNTFSGCIGFKEFIIPNSVTSIGESAFQGCTGLLTVSIPSLVNNIEKNAFAECKNIENVYCYAEKVPTTDENAFLDALIEYTTLHIPAIALNEYKETEPWKGFEKFVVIEGTETKKCATPNISYQEGKLIFTCETEGAECYYTLKSSDFKPSNTIVENGSIGLSACYDITSYAVSVDCVKSDTATAKLYWLPSSGSLESAGINNVSMRGIAIQSAGGFINISGLDNNEKVNFYGIDGKSLGSATAINGTTSFAAQSGSIVVAKIGKENIKIAVK